MKKQSFTFTLIELIVVLASICLFAVIIALVICMLKFDYRYAVKDHDGEIYYTDNIEYDGNRVVFVDEYGRSHTLTSYSIEELR